MFTIPEEPTYEDCNAHKFLGFTPEHERKYACWYPQMGGYSSKAVIITTNSNIGNECFDAFIWHNGEFPFSDTEESPRRIHHCMPSQFIDFGELVIQLQEQKDVFE